TEDRHDSSGPFRCCMLQNDRVAHGRGSSSKTAPYCQVDVKMPANRETFVYRLKNMLKHERGRHKLLLQNGLNFMVDLYLTFY
ncbi:MAG TPA: hypothetical protein VGF52_00505, partial [Tepidisphaeraceae bacterium]